MTSVGEADQAIGADERLQSARHLVSRPELFATLFLLGILNALTAVLFPLVHSENPGQALSQLSTISFPTVAAIVVGLHLLLRSPDAPIKRCDWLAAAIVALLLLVPHRAGSWLAITGLALFSLGRDHRSTTAVAAASIFMALAASSFWGPILVQVFGSTFLAWDAALAAALLDVLGDGEIDRIGNVIVTSDQTRLLVMVWCSALPNLLYGFLWWTVLARLVRPAWQPTDLLALLAVGGLVLTANTLRLALMGLSAHTYQWIHGSIGANAFNIGLLLVITAIALHSTTGPAASSLHR